MSVAEKNMHAANLLDFETNYETQSVPVTEMVVAETTFIIDLNYTNFKSKIVAPILWNDTKYVDGTLQHFIFISSNSPL